MDFEQLLVRLWGFDYECFAHDTLMVASNYRTREERVFHNSGPDDYETFLAQENPIFMGYNCKSYDKYILKACILGYGPEEVKEISDHIIAGNNGWDYPFVGYCTLPPIWDLFDCIKTFKSLKEIEGNLRMNITETTIPFDLPTKIGRASCRERV